MSVDALQLKVIWLQLTALAVMPIGTDGAIRSASGSVVDEVEDVELVLDEVEVELVVGGAVEDVLELVELVVDEVELVEVVVGGRLVEVDELVELVDDVELVVVVPTSVVALATADGEEGIPSRAIARTR